MPDDGKTIASITATIAVELASGFGTAKTTNNELCTKRAFHWACITLQCEHTFGFESERPGESMGEVVGRKKKAVAAGALALLGPAWAWRAVAWGSEGSVPEEGVRSGDVWAPLVGKKLEEKAGALARSHRAEVQRALAAHRASEAVEREAATEAGEQTPAEAAGAQDAHLSAEGPGTSSGEAAGACSEEADRADEQRGGQGPSNEREVRRKAGDSPLGRVRLGPSLRKEQRRKAALLPPGRCHPSRVRARRFACPRHAGGGRRGHSLPRGRRHDAEFRGGLVAGVGRGG